MHVSALWRPPGPVCPIGQPVTGAVRAEKSGTQVTQHVLRWCEVSEAILATLESSLVS